MAKSLKNSMIQLNSSTVQAVRKEYNLDKPGMMEQAVATLQDWIQKQEHFVKKDFHRDYLERIIISTKGSVEKAKKRIDRMCTMRTMVPKLFEKCHAKNDFPNLQDNYINLNMPKMTDDYYRIFIAKINGKQLSPSMFLEGYQHSVLVSEYIMKLFDYSFGCIVICDLRDTNIFDLVTKVDLVDLRNAMMLYTKTNDDLSINSRVLLNSDKKTLEMLFIQHNVDPNSVDDMMRTINDWYQKEPHLPAGQLHDQFVARLLVMRKFSVEKVKQKIDNNYSVRPKMAEFLSNRDPTDPNLKKYLKNGYWIVLPRRTPENDRVTIFRIKSSEGVIVIDLIKVILMITEYRMWNDSVIGEHLIMDFRNVVLQLALQLTPVIVSKIIYYLFECLGPKIKGIHVVNLPLFAETILSLCKKLLKPKVVKRIHIYKNFEEVFRKLPEDIFPKDLGGTDENTCQDITDAWERTLCSTSWRNYFIEQDNIHSDETKRIIKKNFHDDFGLDGSFKKLSID